MKNEITLFNKSNNIIISSIAIIIKEMQKIDGCLFRSILLLIYSNPIKFQQSMLRTLMEINSVNILYNKNFVGKIIIFLILFFFFRLKMGCVNYFSILDHFSVCRACKINIYAIADINRVYFGQQYMQIHNPQLKYQKCK